MIEDGYDDINAMRRKILKLKRELTQLREDRRVLGVEVKAWRERAGKIGYLTGRHFTNGVLLYGGGVHMPEADAVDKSGALGRAQG